MSKSEAKEAPKSDQKELDKLRGRLVKATFAISEQVNTALRNLIDQYPKHMNMTMRHNADSEFPISVKVQPFQSERTMHTNKGSVLMFHIGNAILAMYEAGLAEKLPAYVKRVEFLEHVAAKGYVNFYVAGSAREGHYLSLKKFSDSIIYDANPD